MMLLYNVKFASSTLECLGWSLLDGIRLRNGIICIVRHEIQTNYIQKKIWVLSMYCMKALQLLPVHSAPMFLLI